MKPKITLLDISNFLNITPQAVHQYVKRNKLKYYKSANKINYMEHEEAKTVVKIKVKPSIISFELVKGGVGKTSLCFNCAIRASLYGFKCALIDLDQQANLTHACSVNIDQHNVMIDIIKNDSSLKENLVNVCNGVDLLPSSFENAMLNTLIYVNKLDVDKVFKEKIDVLKKDYDFIFIDCPPDLDAAISAAILASDLIISPIEPDKFSISGLELTIREIKNISTLYNKEIPIKIVLNKFDDRTNLSHQTLCKLLKNDSTSELLLKTFINTSQEFPNCFDRGVSVFETFKKSTAKTDIDFLTKEIIEMFKIS